MKKSPYLIVSIVLFVLVLLFFLYLQVFKVTKFPKLPTPPVVKGDIEVFLPVPNQTVVSPLKIIGVVKGNGWAGFEGQVGIVKLFDSSGKELALGILTATTDWMSLPTNFETTLFFDYPGDGTGQLVFYNENASGEPERNKTFTLPVQLQKSSSERIKVKVYLNAVHEADEGNVVCDEVFPLEREIPKTQAVARIALEELLKGPTDSEILAGFATVINNGVKIQSLSIVNGVAKVDFNEALQQGVAGSCKVLAIRAQITETLKQFPTVKDVVISINGKTEGILQP